MSIQSNDSERGTPFPNSPINSTAELTASDNLSPLVEANQNRRTLAFPASTAGRQSYGSETVIDITSGSMADENRSRSTSV